MVSPMRALRLSTLRADSTPSEVECADKGSTALLSLISERRRAPAGKNASFRGKACIVNKTFGCTTARHMWARAGCQGLFMCRSHRIACGNARSKDGEFQCGCNSCNAARTRREPVDGTRLTDGEPPGLSFGGAPGLSAGLQPARVRGGGHLYDLRGYGQLIAQHNFTERVACERERASAAFSSLRAAQQARRCEPRSQGGAAQATGPESCSSCELRGGFSVSDTVAWVPRRRRVVLLGDSLTEHVFEDLTFLIRFACEGLRLGGLPHNPPERWSTPTRSVLCNTWSPPLAFTLCYAPSGGWMGHVERLRRVGGPSSALAPRACDRPLNFVILGDAVECVAGLLRLTSADWLVANAGGPTARRSCRARVPLTRAPPAPAHRY